MRPSRDATERAALISVRKPVEAMKLTRDRSTMSCACVRATRSNVVLIVCTPLASSRPRRFTLVTPGATSSVSISRRGPMLTGIVPPPLPLRGSS